MLGSCDVGREVQGMFRIVCVCLFLSLGSCAMQGSQSATVGLTVFDCGYLEFNDVTAFGLTNEETEVRQMFVPCYLITHPKGKLIWDAGLDPAIAGKGKVLLQPGAFQSYDRTLVEQLAEMDITPQQVTHLALSHFHFDHAGSANFFQDARLLIQRPEYEAAFVAPEKNPVFDYKLYSELKDNEKTLLDGDHDVFGDGSVVVISAPGHTPGHQVLLVRLESTGNLLLSGDLYHFRESRRLRRTPVFNTNAQDTLAAMDKVEALLRSENATLWIEHDLELARTLQLAPYVYR